MILGASVLPLLLLAAVPAAAQTGASSVRLEVARNIVTLGEPLEVTVSISVEGRSGYDEYYPPVMPAFRLSGSAMTSQNIEVINWRIRRRETYVYHAIPTRLGRQTIGPAAIRIGGRTLKSDRVAVEVRAGQPGASPPPPGTPDGDGQDEDGSDARQPDTAGAGAGVKRLVPPDGIRAGVFIAVTGKPDKVYVGEQLVVAWHLYTQSDVLGYQPGDQPSTEDFWSEDLQTPQRLSFEREVLAGRVFYSALVWRKALFPQKAGKLTVGPLSARVRTLQQFTRPSSELRSPPLELEVLPLPEKGRPDGFAPQNVGQYQIAALVDRNRLKVGEAVQLRVVVRGRGNLPQLSVKQLEAVDGFKVYDPKISERLTRDEGIAGEKTIEYLLLPTRAGKLTIPPLQLDYFDPQAEKYQRVRTEPVTITVTGSLPTERGPGAGSTTGGRQNILGLDIRPPRSPVSLSHRRPFRFLEGLTVWLFALPVALFFGLTGVELIRARLRRQTARTVSRQLARRVRQHLRGAADAARHRDGPRCYSELAAAIQVQLDERLGQRVEGMTRAELLRAMVERGFDDALVSRVSEELDSADFGRFAGPAATATDLETSLASARRLVGEIAAARLRPRGGGDGARAGEAP